MSFVAVGVSVVSIGVGLYQSNQASNQSNKDRNAAMQMASQAASAEAARQVALKKQMAIEASKSEALRINSNTNVRNKKAQTTRIVLTLSIIGGTLLVGTIIAIVALKKK